jgi:hypothetical protein
LQIWRFEPFQNLIVLSYMPQKLLYTCMPVSHKLVPDKSFHYSMFIRQNNGISESKGILPQYLFFQLD